MFDQRTDAVSFETPSGPVVAFVDRGTRGTRAWVRFLLQPYADLPRWYVDFLRTRDMRPPVKAVGRVAKSPIPNPRPQADARGARTLLSQRKGLWRGIVKGADFRRALRDHPDRAVCLVRTAQDLVVRNDRRTYHCGLPTAGLFLGEPVDLRVDRKYLEEALRGADSAMVSSTPQVLYLQVGMTVFAIAALAVYLH
jgi:hypothetical protein